MLLIDLQIDERHKVQFFLKWHLQTRIYKQNKAFRILKRFWYRKLEVYNDYPPRGGVLLLQ